MLLRAAVTVLILANLANPLTAQAIGPPPRELRPKPCPAADSLVGHPMERPKGSILGTFDRTQALSMIYSVDPWTENASPPLTAVWATTHFPGEGPVAVPTLGFQLRLKDTVLRRGPQAHLALQFDDAPTVQIGEMRAQPVSSGSKVDQVLGIGLTAAESRSLVGATKVTGTIGSTAFTVPRGAHDGMRAVFLAAACGVKLK